MAEPTESPSQKTYCNWPEGHYQLKLKDQKAIIEAVLYCEWKPKVDYYWPVNWPNEDEGKAGWRYIEKD